MTTSSRQHDQSPTDELLARYLSGECTSEERLWVERWVSLDPARDRLLADMAALWSAPALGLEEWDAAGMRSRFRAKLRSQHLRALPPWLASPPPSRWRWAAAAAALVLVAAGTLLKQRVRPSAPRPVEVAATADSSRFSTRRGQRATITLTDGSTVVLGVNSRLAVAPRFGDGARVVSLEGEAFFDVAPDSAAPFIVRTASSVTQVVGTAFSVRQEAGEKSASIAVQRGRVAVGSTGPAVFLARGDVGYVTPGSETRVRHDPLAVAALTSWKDGWFTLDHTPMDQAARALARWYDIDVRIPASQLRARRVNISFRDEAPDVVLRAIAEAIDARVEWSGRTVTFYSR